MLQLNLKQWLLKMAKLLTGFLILIGFYAMLTAMEKQSRNLIENYYQAFNSGDFSQMLSYLHDEIIHEVNQGLVQKGKPVFQQFLNHMNVWCGRS